MLHVSLCVAVYRSVSLNSAAGKETRAHLSRARSPVVLRLEAKSVKASVAVLCLQSIDPAICNTIL